MVLNARLSDTMYQAARTTYTWSPCRCSTLLAQTVQMNTGCHNRSAISLLPRFDPDAAFSIMERDNVTIFAGVPTMYWALLNHPSRRNSIWQIAGNLRLAVSGGSAMPVEVMRAFGEIRRPNPGGLWAVGDSPVATFNRLDRPGQTRLYRLAGVGASRCAWSIRWIRTSPRRDGRNRPQGSQHREGLL